MKIQIRLFATLREAFGSSKLEKEVPSGTTVADLVSLLREDVQTDSSIANLHRSAKLHESAACLWTDRLIAPAGVVGTLLLAPHASRL